MSRRSLYSVRLLPFLALLVGACASNWKIHGGPQECVQMCNNWGLVFAGMVGVGDQSRTGEGATACVCQVSTPAPTSGGNAPPSSPPAEGVAPSPSPGANLGPANTTDGSAAATASLAAPITAAQAAAAAHAAQQQQLARQSHMQGR